MANRLIRIGHSPDPDDAFMFYGLLKNLVALEGFRFEEVVEPIEDLNRRALKGDLEMTAISAHAYAKCSDLYWIMSAGASLGRGYGPLLVATRTLDGAELKGKIPVAVPGELTTAALVTRLVLPDAVHVPVPFDEVPGVVLSGRVAAGVLIHEGQLTYASQGLVRIMDFGEWWAGETSGLPLPLGLDAVRSDLGEDLARALNRALKDSISRGFEQADSAMEYARGFGRGIDPEVNRRFVRMYVNDDTRELPGDARAALDELYRRAVSAGCLERAPQVRVIG